MWKFKLLVKETKINKFHFTETRTFSWPWKKKCFYLSFLLCLFCKITSLSSNFMIFTILLQMFSFCLKVTHEIQILNLLKKLYFKLNFLLFLLFSVKRSLGMWQCFLQSVISQFTCDANWLKLTLFPLACFCLAVSVFRVNHFPHTD